MMLGFASRSLLHSCVAFWTTFQLYASIARASDVFDVVVVGSGPGGLIAAEFLSRDPSVSVIVLEAGGPSLQATGGTDVPSYATAKGFTKFDIPGEYDASGSIFSVDNAKYKVDYIDDAQLYLGQLVGGCSSLNGALYFRTPDSYVAATSWPFPAEQVASLFDENEKLFATTDKPSPDGQWYVQDGYEIVSAALTAAGYTERGLNDEDALNAKDKTFGHPPFAIKDGLRDSPAKTCWGAMTSRSNVKLLTEAKVSYIEHDNGKATSVVYNGNQTVELSDRGAVIMAAGAVGTPKVLLQSSIGPEDQMTTLQALSEKFPGVKTDSSEWVINENVGKSLFDTTLVLPTFTHDDMVSFFFTSPSESYEDQYMTNQTGPLAFPGPLLISYENYEINGRAYEFQMTVLTHGMDNYATASDGFTTALYINNPESRDYVSFSSDGKYHAFTKGTAYLSTDSDMAAMKNYTEKVVAVLESGGATFVSGSDGQSPSDWVSSKGASWTNHYGGSCYASGDASDSARCADDKLLVVGTSNIYVGDGSAMKEGTVNPYGFIMYIGRQVAEIISDDFVSGSTSEDASDEFDSSEDASEPSDSSEEEAGSVETEAPAHKHKLRVRIHSA